MSLPNYEVRRATVDDLAQLVPLWESVRCKEPGLERRVTEFQLVQDDSGRLLGLLGLEQLGRQAKLHSEAFLDFAQADELRELLWARTQSVAHNHGITRIWTAESAPFWTHNGFHPADAEAMKKLPPVWNGADTRWLTMAFRDEMEIERSLEREFERLRSEARQDTQKTLKISRALNVIILIGIIILFTGALLFFLHLKQRQISPP